MNQSIKRVKFLRYTEGPLPGVSFIMSFQCQIKENLNKLIPISLILRIIIILNCKTSTAQLTLLLNEIVLHTKIEDWKKNWTIFHI